MSPDGKPANVAKSSIPIVFGLTIGFLSVLGPLSIDLYLPALPQMEQDFRTTSGSVQLTLSVFFLALAAAQIPIGSFGDRFGRRLPLLLGLSLFIVATIGCALSTSIEQLIFCRFLQGFGACAGTAVSRAMIRDLHSGHEAARLMAFSFLIIGVSPIAAPFIGSVLLSVMPWRGIFWLLSGAGVIALVAVWFLLPESLPVARRLDKRAPLLPAYADLVRNRAFVSWAVVAGLVTTIPFAFVTVAPFLYSKVFSLDAHTYSLLLAVNSVCSIASTQFAPNLMRRWGGRQLAVRLGGVGIAVTIAFGVMALVVTPPLVAFQLYSMLVFILTGLLLTPSAISSMDAAQSGAGAASGLLGTIQLAVTAIASAILALFSAASVMPLLILLVVVLVLVLGLALSDRRGLALDNQASA